MIGFIVVLAIVIHLIGWGAMVHRRRQRRLRSLYPTRTRILNGGADVIIEVLLIKKCSDSMLWYAGLVGEYVPFIRRERDCYISREPAGYTNIVRLEDAEVVQLPQRGGKAS